MNSTHQTQLEQSIKEKIQQSNSRVIWSSFLGSKPEEIVKEILLLQPLNREAKQLVQRGKITTEDNSPLSDDLWEVIVQDLKDDLGYEGSPFMAFQNPEEGNSHVIFFWVNFDEDGEVIHKDLNPDEVKVALQSIQETYETPQLILSDESDNERQE